MKRLFTVILLSVIVLFGCGAGGINFDREISELERISVEFALGVGDIKEAQEAIESFNAKLDEVTTKDSEIKKYIDLQREANELRLESFREMDRGKINESTALLAQALEKYDEIKDAH